jgi:hypothetical protein
MPGSMGRWRRQISWRGEAKSLGHSCLTFVSQPLDQKWKEQIACGTKSESDGLDKSVLRPVEQTIRGSCATCTSLAQKKKKSEISFLKLCKPLTFFLIIWNGWNQFFEISEICIFEISEISYLKPERLVSFNLLENEWSFK